MSRPMTKNDLMAAAKENYEKSVPPAKPVVCCFAL